MIPRLASHVRLRFEPVRGAWVLLAPERVLFPDAVAADVLRRLDGRTPVKDIVATLAADYDADPAEIAADVTALLEELAAAGVVER